MTSVRHQLVGHGGYRVVVYVVSGVAAVLGAALSGVVWWAAQGRPPEPTDVGMGPVLAFCAALPIVSLVLGLWINQRARHGFDFDTLVDEGAGVLRLEHSATGQRAQVARDEVAQWELISAASGRGDMGRSYQLVVHLASGGVLRSELHVWDKPFRRALSALDLPFQTTQSGPD